MNGKELGLAKGKFDGFLEGFAVLDGLELGNGKVFLDGDSLG
jgi:hypothetical protein